MRRRSTSALSTAAVRLVSSWRTWAAWSWSAVGPSRARARASSTRAMPTVTHGAIEQQSDDADGCGEPGATVPR